MKKKGACNLNGKPEAFIPGKFSESHFITPGTIKYNIGPGGFAWESPTLNGFNDENDFMGNFDEDGSFLGDYLEQNEQQTQAIKIRLLVFQNLQSRTESRKVLSGSANQI